jgi:hypothetical protein
MRACRWIEHQLARQLEVNADERTRCYEGIRSIFRFPPSRAALRRGRPAMQAARKFVNFCIACRLV